MTSTSTAALVAKWLAAHQDELITDGNCCKEGAALKTRMTWAQCQLRQKTYYHWYSGEPYGLGHRVPSPMFMLCKGCAYFERLDRNDKAEPNSRRVRSVTNEVVEERIAKAKSKEKPKTKGRSGNDDIFAWRKRRNTKAAWKARKR